MHSAQVSRFLLSGSDYSASAADRLMVFASMRRFVHDVQRGGCSTMQQTARQLHPLATATRWRYRVARERAAIGLFADAMEADLAAAGISESVRQSLATVLDELLANVVMHAQAARGPVHVHMRRRKDELIVRLRYSASAFDPTAIAEAQLPASIAAATPGGVGIAMVRAMTREFVYCYRRGENHLRVRVALVP